MKRITKEQAEARRKQRQEDAELAVKVLSAPAGAALIRYLEVLWARRGLGASPEKTAYRVALRDAIEQMKDIRQEGTNAA